MKTEAAITCIERETSSKSLHTNLSTKAIQKLALDIFRLEKRHRILALRLTIGTVAAAEGRVLPI